MPKMTYEPQTKSFAFTFDKRRKMNPDAGARCVREGGREGRREGRREGGKDKWFVRQHFFVCSLG